MAIMDSRILSASAPSTIQCRRLNFASTDPPLPEYADHFAAVIDNVFTETECNELIRLAESSTLPAGSSPASTSRPRWEPAMINAGNGKQVLAPEERNCGRIILDTPEVAEELLTRLRPFLYELGLERIENKPLVTGLADGGEVFRLSRLNERLRFLKYEGGEYFRPHWDAFYMTPDQRETSYYTIHVYLNGEGEQDVDELMREMRKGEGNRDKEGRLLGGATSFLTLARHEDPTHQVRVFPRTGSVLVFQQNDLLHGGDAVVRGTKYTLRTDIMYESEEEH